MAIENAIFETALAIEAGAERERFLARVYPGDEAALARMRELVALAGESAAYFLESQRDRAKLAGEAIEHLARETPQGPPPADSAADERPGARIDRYVLVRKIGEGGSGVVYEAEQEGMRRTVALKILRSDSRAPRHDTERHALELMDHPGIARVFDAGRTRDGRPYFVLELVRGQPITTYCSARLPGLRERVALFVQVCHAIQHAHQKGIIHSDIKPTNILVAEHDGRPAPKVIDFGIAKAAAPSRGAAPDLMAGTPAYMSPEQIEFSGRDVDTRSDIYSLGALLYELLAGRPPFDSRDLLRGGLLETRRLLLESEPPPPSAVQRNAGCEPGGDLDHIVAMAMRKDRNRRYHTANSLAADLERFLADQPVAAREASRGYLIRKFLVRNRLACLAAAAVALAMLASLGTATHLYLREKQALAEQALLKGKAEASRAEEARLRAQAQARANVSRVAILLADGKIQEADLLLQQSPLESVEPSLEATDVFRSLGNWNAIYGRWSQALACFRLMNQANRLRDPQEFVEGTDILITAPVFLEAGDREGYAEFRREVIARHQPCRNSLQAEHLLKACLLVPVEPDTIRDLEGAAEACRAGIAPPPGRKRFESWEALSLALFEFRKGEHEQALRRAEQCLSFDDPAGTRAAAARCLAALACHRTGRAEAAAEHLATARAAIETPAGDTAHPAIGNWFAWSVARILLREARAEIGR